MRAASTKSADLRSVQHSCESLDRTVQSIRSEYGPRQMSLDEPERVICFLRRAAVPAKRCRAQSALPRAGNKQGGSQ